MGEDGGDGEAAGALDVHEERSGSGDEGLIEQNLLVFSILFIRRGRRGRPSNSYLELVLLGLRGRGGVQKINSENLNANLLAKFFSAVADSFGVELDPILAGDAEFSRRYLSLESRLSCGGNRSISRTGRRS